MDPLSRLCLRVLAWGFGKMNTGEPAGASRRAAWNELAEARGAAPRRPGRPSGFLRPLEPLRSTVAMCPDVMELPGRGVALRLETVRSHGTEQTLCVAPYALASGPRFHVAPMGIAARPLRWLGTGAELDIPGLDGRYTVRDRRGGWRALLSSSSIGRLRRFGRAQLFSDGRHVVLQWDGFEDDPARLEAAIALVTDLATRDAERLRAALPPEAEWSAGRGRYDRWSPPSARLKRQGVTVRVAPVSADAGPGVQASTRSEAPPGPFRVELQSARASAELAGLCLEPTERARLERSGAALFEHDGARLCVGWSAVPTAEELEVGVGALALVAARTAPTGAYR